MSLRSVATAFGVVGGLCWVVRYFSDREVLEPAGLILLGIASAAAGAALVNRSAVPLRLFVAVAFPLLVWSVLELVRDAGPDRSIDAGFGAAAVVSAVVVWLRRPVRSGRHAPGRTRDAAHRGE
jgi:uncharacterized membrane protein HdeD (DUF308 family)